MIKTVETEAQLIGKTLDFNVERLPPHETLRSLLENAALGVENAGRSLASVRNQTQVVLNHKNKVLQVLRTIDSRISQLGSLLPPNLMEQTPVIVETGMFFVIDIPSIIDLVERPHL